MTSSNTEDNYKKSLLDTAKALTFTNKVSVIPCNSDKQPALKSVIDKRNSLRTEEELREYFDPSNGGIRAKYLAILLDSPMPLCALDLDRRGLNVFMTKILPRCSEQLQQAINKTTRTQTPSNSLHLLFGYSIADFPDKIFTHKYWQAVGSDSDHNEINLMGTGYYLVEYGPGYKTIIGLDSLQTLNKGLMDELIGVLKKFESETNACRVLCAPEKLVHHYRRNNRDALTLHLSGYLHRNGVPEYLIHDLQDSLMESVGGDEESANRHDVIQRTCAKSPDKVNGYTPFLNALEQDRELIREINRQFTILGYQGFFDKPGAGGHASQETSEKYNQKAKDDEDEEKSDKHYDYVQRFSNEELLAEAIIVSGRPFFAVANHNEGTITVERELIFEESEDDDVPESKKRRNIVRPQLVESYLSKPYSFKSKEEFYSVLDLAKLNTLDSLFITVKNIWAKYIDADDNHLSICAADTIFSYFQSEIGMTHYLFFVGDNDSGKSNNLAVFHFIGYRNLMSIGISVANIYQYLGSNEEGIGTICEDEANNIEDDKDKMEIAKSGYTKGYPVVRMTITPFGRVQHRYNTFCLKLYSAEKAPDPVKAKGLIQRIIKLRCTAGDPQNDILEVANPAGDKKLQILLDELSNVHNLLLCHRLLHAKEEIPDIKINLKNREKQLFKPVLRLFQGTDTFKHLCKVMSHYVVERRAVKKNTLHAFLAKLILEMDEESGYNDLTVSSSDKIELTTHDIWTKITTGTAGQPLPNRPLSYECIEFGIISQRGVTLTAEDVFKAEYKNSDGTRKLVFDRTTLKKIASLYTDSKVSIALDSDLGDNDNNGPNSGSADSADSADVGSVSRDTHPHSDEKNEESKEETKESSDNTTENTKDLDPSDPNRVCIPSTEAYYAHYPHSEEQEQDKDKEEDMS